MFDLYVKKVASLLPEYDNYGMLINSSIEKKDEWRARSGIASALDACSEIISEPAKLFKFLIEKEALGDKDERVRRIMLNAGLHSIYYHGKNNVTDLVSIFDKYLKTSQKSSDTHDWIRESVVILLGTLAQHLDHSDPLISQVIQKLLSALKTPSETVQIAVSECLPSLIKNLSQTVKRDIFNDLLNELFESKKYCERRGAAYGISGAVKGAGTSSLKEFGLMAIFKEAVEDKKKKEKREGALFVYETLSYSLGRMFEPYIITILPLLLVCYGDQAKEVRAATEITCRVIMSKLSGHCVKLVLPSILNGLMVENWRTKLGSVEVLGSMAFLAPKQLSLSLPQIVPRLTEALSDTHERIHGAAKVFIINFRLL